MRQSNGMEEGGRLRPRGESAVGHLVDKKEARCPQGTPGFQGVAGDGLLSHALSSEVPSALQVLTTGFGMGPGVAPAR